MEFHEKLQELRKQKGLTQEELAQLLYVSRTAVSKWESGRGYPNIDSLKAIAKFYAASIDELLSGEEVLTLAEEEHRQKENHFRDLVFGLLDCGIILFLLLPLFRQKVDGVIQEVSLLALTGVQPYLKVAYFALVIGMVASGILTLALRGCRSALWEKCKRKGAILLNAGGVLLFTISLQPYAAVFAFLFLAIKVSMLAKK